MIGLNEENEAQHLGTPAVARRYDKTTRTIDRWAEDPDLGFPKPMYIRGRKFWALTALMKWERERFRLSFNPTQRSGDDAREGAV